MENGNSGPRRRSSVAAKAASATAGGGELRDRAGAAPALVRGPDQGVDQQQHAAGGQDRAGDAGTRGPGGGPPAGHQPVSAGEDQRADRQVDEQHPPPPGALGQHAAEEHPGRRGQAGDRAPDAGRPVPVVAGVEARGQDRQPGRRHQRRAGALPEPGAGQHARARGQAAGQRAGGEQRGPGREHPPPSEQVAGAAAEQQQPAVGDQVARQHPLQSLRREAQIAADRRQGHVHDRGIGDVEELHRAQQQQLAAAGGQQRSGSGGHETGLQDWTG